MLYLGVPKKNTLQQDLENFVQLLGAQDRTAVPISQISVHLTISMIRGVIIVNNHGKPRLVKFYQTVVSRQQLTLIQVSESIAM